MPNRVILPSDSAPAGWGPVPTTNRDIATAIPPTPTGTSDVQVRQDETATAQNAAQSVFLAPAPVLSEIVNGGRITAPWCVWFQKLNQKLGGYNTQYLSTVTATAPITGTGTSTDPILIHVADSTHDGYLSQTDWATFDGKQDALGYTPANKAGDTFTGDVKFSAGVGFFNTAPVTVKPSAPTAATALTSAFGTGGTSLSDVGAAFNQTTLNNNFKSVVDKTTNLESRIAAIYAAIQSLGLQA